LTGSMQKGTGEKEEEERWIRKAEEERVERGKRGEGEERVRERKKEKEWRERERERERENEVRL